MNTPVRIQRLRRLLGDTQATFAVKLGVSRRTVEQWEQGGRRPSEANADKITALYDAAKARIA